MKLKRFNLLLLLALLVTIGGVYASWSFSQGDAAESTIQLGVRMGAISTKGEKGSIEIVENTLNATVENDGNNKTKLVIEGYLKIKYVPSVNADAESVAAGVVVQIAVSENFETFRGEHLFDVHEPHTLNNGVALQANEEYIIYGLDLAEYVDSLSRHIDMTPFEITSETEYNALQAVLTAKDKGFTIVLSEK